MGYDLHITRKDDWSEQTGPLISEAEWRSLIESDPQLTLDTQTKLTMSGGDYVFAAWNGQPGALGYYGGEITATDPSEPLIDKMVQIARALGASVQGDDGEVYGEDGTSSEREDPAPPTAAPGLLSRIGAWLRHRRTVRELQKGEPAFRVGQRVQNPWGVQGVVLHVDRKANGGLGSVRIRLDDGREQLLAYVASGLEIVGETQA